MTDVDRWLDAADHPLDPVMRRAREIILGADERVTESIKWKTPTFAYKGNIASFNPSKRVVSIMRFTDLDLKRRLTGQAPDRRSTATAHGR